MSFVASHTVPPTGLQTFPSPDPSLPEGPLLEAGLDVQVLERQGDWAHVACSNGWEAWVNGALLVGKETTTPPAPAPPPAPSGPPPLIATAPSVRADPFEHVGKFAAGGAALIALSSFFNWYAVFRIGISAWDVPVTFLFDGADSGGGGLRLGLVLLVSAVVVLVPMITKKADNRFLLGGGIAAAACVVLALFRLFSTDGLDLGLALVVGAAGAGLVLYEAWQKR